MVSKIWLLNTILALAALFFGLRAYGVWSGMEKGVELSEVTSQPVQVVSESESVLSERNSSPESDFESLVSRNLFSPARAEIIDTQEKKQNEKNEMTAAAKENLEKSLEQVTLYGVMITDNSAEALVSVIPLRQKPVRRNPRKPKIIQGKKNKWVMVGDSIGEFEVAEINPEGLVLKAGSVTFDLLLYEAGKAKKRAPAKPKAAPVVVGAVPEKIPPQGENNQKRLQVSPSGGAKAPKPGLPPRVAPQGGAPQGKVRGSDSMAMGSKEAFEKLLKKKESSTP